MKYETLSGEKIDILETRPLALENLNPMVHEIVRQNGMLISCIQVKILYLGKPTWITVRKSDLVKK